MKRRLKITVTRVRRAWDARKTVVAPLGDVDRSVDAEAEITGAQDADREAHIQACINSLLEMAEIERNR